MSETIKAPVYQLVINPFPIEDPTSMDISVMTYNQEGRVIYPDRGVFLNPMRKLTDQEVLNLQSTLDVLGIKDIKIDPEGFTIFDKKGYGLCTMSCFIDDPKYLGFTLLNTKNGRKVDWYLKRLQLTDYLETIETIDWIK